MPVLCGASDVELLHHLCLSLLHVNDRVDRLDSGRPKNYKYV
jgi:hypothetical protein